MKQNNVFFKTLIISNVALSILIILYLFTSPFISVHGKTATIEGLVGIIGAFIGVCTTLMLGAQIYTVFRSSQSEKELQNKLKEVEDKYDAYSRQIEIKLNEVSNIKNEIEYIRYHNNDSLAAAHYIMNSKFRGTLNVLDNIHLLLTKKVSFDDNVNKYKFAIYSIAKNFKEYKSDVYVINNDKKHFEEFFIKWNERFVSIIVLLEKGQEDDDDLLFLNEVISSYHEDCKINTGMADMNVKHHSRLCMMAKD